ncbi:hypothetical protein VTN49DRAFT_6859 [Thermomyces lanuginosus]|uniref:uncharacterized protein n=1 Tax=Thermomyces lanuginosus TaxID=5541 RepID=UPI00374413B1
MESLLARIQAGWVYAVIVLVLYVTGLVVYRLYFSPLSKFPGPKLAAATLLYEFYYDVVRRGQYTFKIKELHKQYGPIIRISPYELHVNDPAFYETLYSQHSPRDKSRFLLNIFDLHKSTFGTEKHDLHRIRRAAINPFFSRQRILRLEPVIQHLSRRLCERSEDFARAGEPIPLARGFSCLVTDVLTEYILTESYNYLGKPEWAPHWHRTVRSVPEYGIAAKYVPWILPTLKAIPPSWVAVADPGMGMVLGYYKACEAKIREIMNDKERSIEKAKQKMSTLPTLFHELLDANLPPEEKSFARLSEECQSIVGAGTETTAHALEVICFHLLDNPDKLQKLREELDHLNPDRKATIPLCELEKLPYLSSVVLEGLRLSYGVGTRLQRIAPTETLRYAEYTIPPGTPVSMTAYIQHHDESIFPHSHKFIPERWLDPVERRRLEKYMVAFSRGSRQCVGMNIQNYSLARAELFITLSTFFRWFQHIEIFDTTREDDIDMKHDLFLPRPGNLQSEGLQVKIYL